MMILEIAVFDYSSAVLAEISGAHRLELCSNPLEGGTTASHGTLIQTIEKISIPVFPIIRPRGGDFFYSDDEFGIIEKDILTCRDLGYPGIVIGILDKTRKIDKLRCSRIMKAAFPMSVTFHRAFDRSADPFEALEDIIEIGCDRILTSGQAPCAEDNLELIADLVQQANGRVIIMPGSGVRSTNLQLIKQTTGAKEFHSSATTLPRVAALSSIGDQPIAPDENEIKAMKQILTRIS